MEIPLYEKIFIELLDQIKTGYLKTNDRVPSEKELADQFNVSRITSKKSLDKLAQFGVIERIRGKGSYVSEALPDLTGFLQDHTQAESPVRAIKQKGMIGLIIPDFSDCYGRELLRSIEKQCGLYNYNLVLKITNGIQEEEDLAINDLVDQGVHGLIIYPVNGEHYTESLLRLVVDKFPLVLIDRYLKGIPACSVFTDNKEASQRLTDYLLDQGHQNIAFISPPEEFTSSIEERILGFTSAFLQRGLAVNPDYIITELFSTLPTFKDAHESSMDDRFRLQEFIQKNPQITAYIACEYEIAVVLADVLKILGKKIPETCSIVCFDHPTHPYNDFLFTHIKQNESEMGTKAVDCIVDQLKNEFNDKQNVVDFCLVEGNTTKEIVQV